MTPPVLHSAEMSDYSLKIIKNSLFSHTFDPFILIERAFRNQCKVQNLSRNFLQCKLGNNLNK